MLLITISHLINVLVAGGMAFLLIINAAAIQDVYGPLTPARSILASMYMAIAVTSLFALVFPVYSIAIAKVLFPLQILYKLSTIFTVGLITHPVVVSNILISMLHAAALFLIFK
jgi:hypothetical protein